MKYFLSIFLLIVMLANVSVAFVQQMQQSDLYELKECSTDDADEKSKVEKEKEIYHLKNNPLVQIDVFSLAKLRKQIVVKSNRLISERHIFLPELPPEA